ncbi:Nitrilotriacetate monooxygenase component B [Actinomycetales bacterium JB111]|nr:Nitrilotriacetate monooxygenase component B [Actinomycetales bacterium JB111]
MTTVTTAAEALAASVETQHRPHVPQHRYREILGQFCTGITVISGCLDGRPVGFTCQSFSALSLDPPLVLVCPQRSSTTWPLIRRTGRFTVSVLGADQRDVSNAFARSGTDKFDGVGWSVSPAGNPVIDGSIAWLDCWVLNEVDGGDHEIVVGLVENLERGADSAPLLFHQGQYAQPGDRQGAGEDR